jgi:hypothetical protein
MINMMMSLVYFLAVFEMKFQIYVKHAVVIMLLTLVSGYSQFSYAESQKSEPTLKQVFEETDEKEIARKGDEKGTTLSKPPGPIDKLDRGVPRTAVAGYISAVKAKVFNFLNCRTGL